jgi:hypothetical protein
MPRKRTSADSSQMALGIKDSELSAAFVCKGIFSANYLHQHFGKSGDFPKLDDVRPIYEKIKNRWLEEYAGLRTRKEGHAEFSGGRQGNSFRPSPPAQSNQRQTDEAGQRFADAEIHRRTEISRCNQARGRRGRSATRRAWLFAVSSRAVRALARRHKQVFFEPRPGTLRLFEKFNEPVKKLVGEWSDKIETSQKFADNHADISAYHKTLKPGDVTLVGLIAEGGQGMRTANNARFLGFLQGTPKADGIKANREEWTIRWLADAEIKPVFLGLLAQNGGDATKPTKDVAAWEACVEPLKEKFSLVKLGFTKSDLHRVVLPDLIAKPEDFEFAFAERKKELLKIWRTEAALKEFWEGDLGVNFDRKKLDKLRTQKEISDAVFCELCHELQTWVKEKRKQWKLLGLRSAENYDDPADAPRVATIYNGLYGRAQFVPFRKGEHTQKWEIGDLRQLPLVMPTRGQEKRLKELAERAMEAKRLTFAGATPPNKLAASVRALADELAAKAPAYLHPSAQLKLLHTTADCLAVLELAVNWEAEKLYGVEGLGPFDEF